MSTFFQLWSSELPINSEDKSTLQLARQNGYDLARAILLPFVIILHVGLVFSPMSPQPVMRVVNQSTSWWFDILGMYIHSFRAPCFFMLSGYFASFVFNRDGLLGLWKGRKTRLILPLIISTPICFMVTHFVFSANRITSNWEFLSLFSFSKLASGFLNYGLYHLWFLYLVLPMNFILALVDQRFFKKPKFILLSSVIGVVGLFILFISAPNGIVQVPVGPIPSLRAFLIYFLFFFFGWCFFKLRRQLIFTKKTSIFFFGLGSVAYVISVFLIYNRIIKFGSDSALIGFANGFIHLFLTLGFFIFFSTPIQFRSKIVGYLTDSSYWIYLIHGPVFLLGSVWVISSTWPAITEAVLLIAFTHAVGFLSYALLARKKWFETHLGDRSLRKEYGLWGHKL